MGEMMKCLATSAVAFAILATAAHGQPVEVANATSVGAPTVTLWRGLQAGQSVDQVMTTLTSYPEVKLVKLKPGKKNRPPSLKVSMKEGGVPVFGSAFSVSTEFDLAGRLQEVHLIGDDECASEAVDKFQQISTALEEKYGEEQTGKRPISELDVRSAISQSHQSEDKETLTYGYATDDVAVILVTGFQHTKPPSRPYDDSPFMQLAYTITKAAYDAMKSQCRNSGDDRAAFGIKYMTRAAFDTVVRNAESKQKADEKVAGDNL